MQWNKTYGGTGAETIGGQAVVQNTDGGYTFVGRTPSFGAAAQTFGSLELTQLEMRCGTKPTEEQATMLEIA